MTEQTQTSEFAAEAEKRLSSARYYIMNRIHVVAAAMARVNFEMKYSTAPGQMPAAETDCHRLIRVDGRRLAGMTDKQTTFLLVHELAHKMLGHGGRTPTRTDGLPPKMVHMLANIAQDFVINKMVYDLLSERLSVKNLDDLFPASDTMSGEPIPVTRDNFWPSLMQSSVEGRPMRLFDPDVSDADSAESVFNYLLDTMPPLPKDQPEDQDQKPKGGKGQPDENGNPGSGKDGDPADGQAQPQPGEQPGKGGDQPDENGASGPENGPANGPANGGQPTIQDLIDAMAGREQGDDSGLAPQPDPNTGEVPTPEAVEHEQTMTNQAVGQAAAKEAEKSRGKAAAWLQRLMDATKRPAINPRTLLERYVRRRTARSDYSLRRMRRVGMHFGMALPTLRSEQLGELIVAIDTSGSVTDLELSQYASDIKAVQKVMKPTSTRVIYCDAKVSGEQVFRRGQKLDLKPKGGGGTKIIPVFRHIKDFNLKSDLIIYMTDGHVPGRLPANLKPKAPVVWLVYTPSRRSPPQFKPDFGDVVHVALRDTVAA